MRTTFLFVGRFFFSIISCARLFYFVDRFFFSIISCTRLFLFRRSFFLFYYLVRTTFYFVDRFFFSIISCARLFFISYVVLFFSTISCARLFNFVDRFFFSFISCARLFFFFNPTLHIKRRALHQKTNQKVVRTRQQKRKNDMQKKSRAHELVEKKKRYTK